MTEVANVSTEVTSVSDPVATAAPEPVSGAPAATQVEDTTTNAPEKTFTQAEVDDVVNKRLARERRKLEREYATRATEPQASTGTPTQEQFGNVEEYADALATHKAQELVRQREAQQQYAQIEESFAEREEEARGKYDDYESVVHNPNLKITPAMAEIVKTSEIGPEIAYHLGSNPKEADRISKLPPFLQAKEIGRIEAKLVANPPVKKSTSAPAPINPVTTRSSGTQSYDTTDPRSVKSMSTSEWIAAERQRQIKNAQAQYNR